MAASLYMRWSDLVFLHWRVPTELLKPLIPGALELDTFGGEAWVALTAFEMCDVAVRGAPPVPTATNFPELNVRTYVKHDGRPGVWFFSLDAGSWVAVMGARTITNLPYYHARMSCERVSETDVTFDSERTHPGAPRAEFRAWYRPTGDVYESAPESFDFWCTERYCLFSVAPDRQLLRLDIEHKRWPLQPAVTDVVKNTMAVAAGFTLPKEPPVVHFAKSLDVVAQWPARA
jgi:uncharacterized protein